MNCVTVCGDSIYILISEQCDDGNVVSGDGCSSTCTIEFGYACVGAEYTKSNCTPICGDGICVTATECDCGTNTPNGCLSDCSAVHPCFVCASCSLTQASVC